MTADVVPLMAGTCKLSSIEYILDPMKNDGGRIGLAYMGEIYVPDKLVGLALIARTSLNEFEIGCMDEIGRRMLESPFAYLSGEFDLPWIESEPGKFLDYLIHRHDYSLKFSQPFGKGLPANLFQDGQPVKAQVRSYLLDKLDAAFAGIRPLSADDAITLGRIPEDERFRLHAA